MPRLTSTDVLELTRAMPDRVHIELGALASAVPTARTWARVVLAGWDLARLADDAGLVLTELVTNAVIHAEGDAVDIWLRADRRRLAIVVGDPSPEMPVRVATLNADELSGRGLMIVGALAECWGACRVPAGKVVWAVLAV
jgi:anti-sigma regulatory factor (Ser/Thr protein kinase)